MKTPLILCLFAALTIGANADLTPEQTAALKKVICNTAAPELPAVIAKLVKEAATTNRNDVAKAAAKLVSEQRPAVLKAVVEAIPAANRPTITPGNENGNRPEVPPGLENYASP